METPSNRELLNILEPLARRLQDSEQTLSAGTVDEYTMRSEGRAVKVSQKVVEALIKRLELE